MAEGIEDIIRGPSYNVNLADVGRVEQVPDLIPQWTKDFQTATNLIETAWVNKYQYQMAQYGLQEAAAKLQGLNTENDLQRQSFQQRADAFPLEQKQRQQGLDEGDVRLANSRLDLQNRQIGLDESKYQLGQRQKALDEMDGWRTDISQLDPNDPNYLDKLAAIDAKYPNAASSQFTQPQRNVILANKNQQYQNSTQQKTRALYAGRLLPLQDPALPGGALIGPNVDINKEIANGNGPQLWQQAQQQEATRRLRALQLRATDPTDKAMIGRLLNEVNNPPGGVSHYGVDGTMDQTTNDMIAGYEQKYGLVNPYAGAKKTIETGTEEGKPYLRTKIENVPVTAQDIQTTQAAPVVAPPGYQYNWNMDPDYQAAQAQMAKDYPNVSPDSPGYKRRMLDTYEQRRKDRGLSPKPNQDEINQNYQASQQANRGNQATTGATNAPVPAPTPAAGSNVQPNIAEPAPTPTPTTRRPASQQLQVAPPGRRHAGFQYVFPEEEAPAGSWQRAWNETVGRTLAGVSDQDIQRGVQEAESRAEFASTEQGIPSWYRREEVPSPSPGDRGGVNNYAPPQGAPAVAGISPSVWGKVMDEEGPEFGPDGRHPSVFGLWGDKPGVESQAYNVARQYGAHSLEAYNAVTGAWMNGFLRQSQPWRLSSPGMQELVIADSQHQGGAAAQRIINQMGGWDRINQMDPREAIAQYSQLRRGLWPGNERRVRREEGWALANS